MDFKNILKQITFFFVFVLLLGTVFFSVEWFSNGLKNLQLEHYTTLSASFEGAVSNVQAQTASLTPAYVLPYRNNTVLDTTILAPSAISVAFNDNQAAILFQKDAQARLPIASLTKLMTAMVVLDNYNLSKKITIDQGAMAQEGEQGELQLGQTLSIESLLYITLIESSNRAAFALSEFMGTAKFIGLMNENAQKLGMTNTHFADATGLDAGSYSSAQDLVTLTNYLFKNYPIFSRIIHVKGYQLYLEDGTFHHTMVNTNALLGTDNIIGGKTGFTTTAKGCFMVIQNKSNDQNPGVQKYTINIVLGSDDRIVDMQAMVDWVDRAYAW